MIQFLTQMISQAEEVILAAVGITAVIYVASVWWRTKALVPTMTAIVMAAVVMFAVNNVDLLQDQVHADSQSWIGGSGAPAEGD